MKRLSDQELRDLVKQNALQIKELREAQAKTDKQLKETDTRLKNFLGGYGDTAEEYFYQSLQKTMRLGEIKFDEIDREVRKKSGWNEFDIVMYNGDSVGIVEVKNRANPKYLQVEKQIRNFKEQFPEFQGYKIYYGVATMSTKNTDLFDFCRSKGLFLLCQNGDHIDLLNSEIRAY